MFRRYWDIEFCNKQHDSLMDYLLVVDTSPIFIDILTAPHKDAAENKLENNQNIQLIVHWISLLQTCMRLNYTTRYTIFIRFSNINM